MNTMKELLLETWWMLALRGVSALAFGVLALLWPGITLVVLIALFAAYALVSGVLALLTAFKQRRRSRDWWLFLLLGLVGLAAGAIALFHPALTLLVLILLIGANALIGGVLDIIGAIRLRKRIHHEWLLILAGLLSVAFGLLMLLFPGFGALALVWIVSFHATLYGALLLALAWRARRWPRATTEQS
ncbi:MAG: DUF308 domain-containing protein [Pseudomonadota bacterium]